MDDVLLKALISIAANDGPGRTGDNPSSAGGALIVVGIAAVVLALAVVGLWVVSKRGSRAS